MLFAGGVAAGPPLIDQGCSLLARVGPRVGMSVPGFVANRVAGANCGASPATQGRSVAAALVLPAASASTTESELAAMPKAKELGGRVDQASVEGQPVVVSGIAAKPEVIPLAPKPESEKPEAVPAPREARSGHHPASTAHKRKGGDRLDSVGDDQGASKTQPVAKASSKSVVPQTTSAKSKDSLDNLMGGGDADSSKNKKRASKDLDALLKDVQKSNPEPPKAKREEPAPAAALSPSDISKVMAGVKTRASECARRLGEKGIAELKISVSKTGAVSEVKIKGKVAGTPLAACIDKAMRAAKFPASSGLRFDYRINAR